MQVAPSLLECQRRFLAAIYYPEAPVPADVIFGHGLEPAARLRIYRHSSEQIHTAALRTTYPVVLALVGEPFFEQAALRYHRAYPFVSGNLQAFGEYFGDLLEDMTESRALAYLPDVARLEWQRQLAALAPAADSSLPPAFGATPAESNGWACMALHPSVRTFASPFSVLTIWLYAMQPTSEDLTLPEAGEHVVVWRSPDGQVAMTALDPASFAAIDTLVHGRALCDALAAARACDPEFELNACMESLAMNGLLTTVAKTP